MKIFILFISLIITIPAIADNNTLLTKMQDIQQTQACLTKQIKEITQQLAKLEQEKAAQDIKWLKIKSKNAFIAGFSHNKPIYICHTQYMKGIHPGQLVKKGCLISYGGRAFIKKDYEILATNKNLVWDSPDKIYNYHPVPMLEPGPVMLNKSRLQSISGGFENNKPLYICRGIYNNRIHVGKQVSGNCNISWQQQEIKLHTYEILYLPVQ